MRIFHNLPQFEAGLTRFEQREIPEIVLRAVRRVVLDLQGRLVTLTPVRTGQARRGWVASTGSPSSWTPAPGLERYEAPTVAEAAAAIATLRFGDTAWIANNVVYIERLNDGHSQQAPVQFVEMALQEAVMALARAA